MSLTLVLVGFAAVAASWFSYLARIPSGNIPVRPTGHIAGQLLGTGAALCGAVLARGSDSAVLAIVLASVAVFFGTAFMILFSLRKTPVGNIAVRSGEPIPDFQVLDAEGRNFGPGELAGRPFVLKFYRGSWCPYCCAELKRFDELRPEFERRGIEFIALSKDSVEDAAAHVERDGIGIRLLSDPELEIIRRFGVEHHKAVEVSTGSFRLFGMSLALVPSIKTMAIPTTILVDENGIIRWIDQSDDYRIRSAERRVLEAIDAALQEPRTVSP